VSDTNNPDNQRFEDERPFEERRTSAQGSKKQRAANPFSTWRARHVRGVSKEILEAESLLLPSLVYESERNPLLPGRDYSGKPIGREIAVREERLIELLRYLGRVYVADAETIYHILYRRRYGLKTAYRDLEEAKRRGYIWTDSAKGLHRKEQVVRTGGNLRGVQVYGLSTVGKQFLKHSATEAEEAYIKMLHAHSPKTANPANQATLGHDLQVSWWCGSMIECLRLIPWCTSIFCHSEVRAHKNQRIDAVIVARFNFKQYRSLLDSIPWYDGTRKHPDEIEVRWALELDNSTESDKVLRRKFMTYRKLHMEGVYHKLFNGNMILVLIAQTADRAATLTSEFQRVWPDGWGLVSTPDRMGADSNPLGVLWGKYLDMNITQPVPLLSRITTSPAGEFGYQPLMTSEMWRTFLILAKEGRAPRTRDELLEHLK
jgi:hypothetical protein